MAQPNLVTAPDEQERCCVLDDSGSRCPNPAYYWVGKNGVDDYTHCCTEHLYAVQQEGDAVHPLKPAVAVAA